MLFKQLYYVDGEPISTCVLINVFYSFCLSIIIFFLFDDDRVSSPDGPRREETNTRFPPVRHSRAPWKKPCANRRRQRLLETTIVSTDTHTCGGGGGGGGDPAARCVCGRARARFPKLLIIARRRKVFDCIIVNRVTWRQLLANIQYMVQNGALYFSHDKTVFPKHVPR